jgi:hypothetical protein
MFLGLYTTYTTVADEYSVTYDFTAYDTQGNNVSFEDAFNRIDETKNDMDNFSLEFEDTLLQSDDNLFSFFNLGLTLGKQVYQSVTSIKDIINIIIEITGIPAETLLLFSLFIVAFIMFVVLLLLGRQIVN